MVLGMNRLAKAAGNAANAVGQQVGAYPKDGEFKGDFDKFAKGSADPDGTHRPGSGEVHIGKMKGILGKPSDIKFKDDPQAPKRPKHLLADGTPAPQATNDAAMDAFKEASKPKPHKPTASAKATAAVSSLLSVLPGAAKPAPKPAAKKAPGLGETHVGKVDPLGASKPVPIKEFAPHHGGGKGKPGAHHAHGPAAHGAPGGKAKAAGAHHPHHPPHPHHKHHSHHPTAPAAGAAASAASLLTSANPLSLLSGAPPPPPPARRRGFGDVHVGDPEVDRWKPLAVKGIHGPGGHKHAHAGAHGGGGKPAAAAHAPPPAGAPGAKAHAKAAKHGLGSVHVGAVHSHSWHPVPVGHGMGGPIHTGIPDGAPRHVR